VTPSRKFKILI